ncbi:hypothetical protein Bca4012_049929 [Brassica carinata]|uniref:Uncharacterized protein n=1 Tax=Brassica carinata TaxID=52824 RepID=A0A8X7R2H9_BRACI|nr:hypothetical protein Bca52824_052673 [Brassica carinata]
MSTKVEIDEVQERLQHGVRRMRPLVAEQQLERDIVKFPRPDMVVRERWSRSSYQEQMEKRLIEIALASGTSMEEIEEIQAMTNYDRPVRTLEEEMRARLEMLEECRQMLDRWDEEDEAKKYGYNDRSERCKKAKGGLLSVMARWLHHHVEGTAEKVNKVTSIAIEISGQLTGQSLL